MRGLAQAMAGGRLPRRAARAARPRHDHRGHADDPVGRLDRRGRGGLPPPGRAGRAHRRRRPEHGWGAGAVDRPRPPGGRRPRAASTRRRGRSRPRCGRCSTRCSPTAPRWCPASAATSPTPTPIEIAYDGTPLRPLLSFIDDGLARDAGPLRRADDAAAAVHVAPGPRRRAGRQRVPRRRYGGDVDHRWLERSYHVATQDYDRDAIFLAATEFVGRVSGRDASASIPSPSSGTLEIGPLSLNAYGLMIALGVVAGVWLFGRRLEEKGIGTREDANAIGIWGVAAGVVGARLYHVITDWDRFEGNLGDVVKIWEGGLGIPGGMLAGVLVGIYVGASPGDPARPGAQRRRPGAPAGPGHRPVGQLVQPGAVRQADRPAVGAGDRPGEPGRPGTRRTARSTRRSCTSRCGTSPCAACCCGSTSASGPPAGGCWRCTCSATASAGSGSRACASTTADELAGLRWNQWVAVACIVGGGLYLLATIHKPKEARTEPVEARAEPEASDDDLGAEDLEIRDDPHPETDRAQMEEP